MITYYQLGVKTKVLGWRSGWTIVIYFYIHSILNVFSSVYGTIYDIVE